MRLIEFDSFGDPAAVARCVEKPDPAAGPGKVVVRMEVMSINPADLLTLEGRYGVRPALPATPGAEGVGRIESLGEGVEGLKVGDLVVPLSGSCWRERLIARPENLIKLPPDIDVEQAAMLKANPATAEALLTLAELSPGDWVMQNAANSAVGRNLIQAARRHRLKTVNVVRRPEPVEALRALGGDAVLVHDDGDADALAAAVAEATGAAKIKLAIDAVGGKATDALAASIADSGLVVNYGLLSGEPCHVDPYHLVFRDIRLQGFWLLTWFRKAGPQAAVDLYGRLIERLAAGEIGVPVEARYPLERIGDALAHAARPQRNGKILLTT
ncbi:MAG: zinc-dependent alcohol dehydrogenase family protein [Kiloniellales bacterium]